SIVGRAVQNGGLDRHHLDEASVSITGSPLPGSMIQDTDIMDALDVEKSINLKIAPGSPSSFSVKRAIDERKKRLDDDRHRTDQLAMASKEAIDNLIFETRRVALEQ
ncbi:MAG TPA: hypothetical protein PK154_05445, partial [Methanoregulaceae archaeon]|nr:hypothetical protein [Methanoregulaceae archaeon]